MKQYQISPEVIDKLAQLNRERNDNTHSFSLNAALMFIGRLNEHEFLQEMKLSSREAAILNRIFNEVKNNSESKIIRK